MAGGGGGLFFLELLFKDALNSDTEKETRCSTVYVPVSLPESYY